MKISKKEIGLALVFTLVVATFAAYVNLYVGERPGRYGAMLSQSLHPAEDLRWSLGADERVKEMRQTIQAELEKGAFKPVVIQLEVLTEEMAGFVYSEYLTYEDGLWSGDMVSKIPQKNMSSFVFESESIISANGTVTAVTVSIKDVAEGYTEEEVPYATVTIVLNEVAGAKPPEPFVQVWSVVPLLVTGLVWIAEGLIMGVPLCFVSLGVVLLVKRGIIPVWKRQLRKPK
ncbi:MAG: DUF4349 domain-containing protein [Candidatus Bathyarchaeota archaeon]|nr:DUF4349 domain-containing protein [Candidatus Bathyarchaeota archaeon]MDH5779804.1 DUF4349 domain-containing protein [Candidatus Bathyarchaeota archaeon]